jgi:hypothetical protein
MKTVLKWLSWLSTAFATLLLFLGSLGYLIGNVPIFGIKWGTYYLFGGYFVQLAILFVVFYIAFRDPEK